jgi:hypothetical protein
MPLPAGISRRITSKSRDLNKAVALNAPGVTGAAMSVA